MTAKNLTFPLLLTDTRATEQLMVISERLGRRLSPMAIPIPVPGGSFFPQPDFSAAVSRTFNQPLRARNEVFASSSERRYRYGSLPAAAATSSMKVSRQKSFAKRPTEMSVPVGTAAARKFQSTSSCGTA